MPQRRQTSLFHQAGNVIVSLIFSLIIMSLAGLAVFPYLNMGADSMSEKQQIESNILFSQSNFLGMLNSPPSWLATIVGAANNIPSSYNLSKCVQDPTYNCPGGAHPLTIYDSAGKVFYDSSNLNDGFDTGGNVCTTFNTPAQNLCDFSWDITWTPQCPPVGICNVPGIQIQFKLSVNAGTGNPLVINPANYSYGMQIP